MCGVGGAAEGHGVWGCRAGASQYEIGCVEQASTPGPFIGLDSVTRGFHLQGVKPHVSSSASLVRDRNSPAAASARALTGCSQGADQFAFSSQVLLASLLAEFRFWYCGTELWAPRRHPSPQAAHGSGCGERLFWMVPSSYGLLPHMTLGESSF